MWGADQVIKSSITKVILVTESNHGMPSLDELLGQHDFLRENHAIALGRVMAQALAELAVKGLCHGTVCPQNVMFFSNGTVKLGFNLLFETSAPYVAPEHLEKGGRSPAGDIYSLGVMLHQMVFGTLPYGNTQESG
jgi:serine/threonine protein kinase